MFRIKMSGRGWAYVGAILGGSVSVAANVAHSYIPPDIAPDTWAPYTGAIIGAVFWPAALLVAIEILARTDWSVGWRWLLIRYGGLAPVAIVAAVVSYRHMSGLLAYYGEDGVTATFGPLAVDGLMVMATGALINTGARLIAELPDTASVPVPDIPTPAAPTPAAVTPAPKRPTRKPKHKPAKPTRVTAAARVAALRTAEPDITQAEAVKRLKVSDRTVERNWNTAAPVNGTPVMTGQET